MDKYGSLHLRWSVGYNGSQLLFVTEDILVCSCGHTLSFTRDDGKLVKSLQSGGCGVGVLATCHKSSLVAYAENKLHPKIFIIDYPACEVKSTLEDGAELEFTSLSFSNDGKKLVTLSGIPDFIISVWNCSGINGTKICSVNVGEGGSEISVNPLNWRQFVLLGPSKIILWNIEKCGEEFLLTPVEMNLPERVDEVGSRTHPKTPLLASAKMNRNELMTGSSTNLYIPPNMSEVYYKGTYKDFIKRKNLVVPKSLCWTTMQTVFVGCNGGQLLMVEVDSETLTMLTNPQPCLDDSLLPDDSSSSVMVKTAHSVLKEGFADCLVLNHRGLFTAGRNGILHFFSAEEDMKLKEEVDLTEPIKHLCWSPSGSRLGIGTETGKILVTHSETISSSLTNISFHQHTRLVGIDVLCPGSAYCVTCRCDGSVQVWRIEDGGLHSSINLETECTCIVCPVSCKVAVVGTASGHLCMVSLADPSNPHVVETKQMHSGPVTLLKHDQAGYYMASNSPNDHVFFYDSRPSTMFAVLGHIGLSGPVLDISLLSLEENDGSVQVAIMTRNETRHRNITYFHLDNSFLDSAPLELYVDSTKEFSEYFPKCRTSIVSEGISLLTIIPGDTAFSFLNSTTEMVQFEFGPTRKVVEMSSYYDGHELKNVKMALSFHKKWFASIAGDGNLLLRLVDNPSGTLTTIAHHYKNGGGHGIVFARNSQFLLTIGDSGTVNCWEMMCSAHAAPKSAGAVSYFNNAMKALEATHRTEEDVLKSLTPLKPDYKPEKTWLVLAKEKEHEDENEIYSKSKSELCDKIENLRRRVLNMISTNEELPELEKLSRQEFILDTEDHQRMLTEEEALIQQVREEIELSILSTKYLREQIKRECWNKMAVKGKTLLEFQGRLEVSNYPLLPRTKSQLKELERIQCLAKIDVVERQLRNEAGQELKQTLQPLRHDELYEDDDYLGELKEKLPGEQEEKGDPDALLGSHRNLYGAECTLLASQFELHSPVYKRHQIILLEDCIYQIRVFFNKEFDEVLHLKLNEINRIREKNVRIAKIISQLKLDEHIFQPSLSVSEDPERILTVDDSEITIERYISPEERKGLEEVSQQEEERKLAAMGDNPRERALEMMMGGRLEANVEEDLFKDFQRPEFMSKDPTEMSEEEILMTREFEKKENAFLEEREKMKKALEAELRKLQSSIAQGMEQFNERLQKLFQFKIRTQTTIHQEELKIFYLTFSLFIEKEVKMKEEDYYAMLEENKVKKVQFGSIITCAKRRVEETKEAYELLATEDKEMDKHFRKEFADCESYVDQLYKLFKKRPRGQKKKFESIVPSTLDCVVPASSQCAFPGGPAPAPAPVAAPATVVENIMEELDNISYMPDGMDVMSWERFVIHRRKKVDSENKVKAAAQELAEVNSFLQRRQMEESRLQHDIQNIFKEFTRLQEEKMIYEMNLDIQFLLKQGQVEVSMGDFIPDFSDSVLIHRSHIEDLNQQIKTLGEAKINSMLECKDFKRSIHMLEWERQKYRLEGESLLDQHKEVQLLKVTKDLLHRLMERDLLSKDAKQKETLEKTLELNKKTHQKVLKEKCKQLKDLTKQVKAKKQENRELEYKLRELQVSVAEHVQLEDLAGVPLSESNRGKSMREIRMRKRLVDSIKTQDDEYSVLKAEMERLRMKTFPALVQID